MIKDYDSDGDGCAEALAEHAAARTRADARSLSGSHVQSIRRALEVADSALARINPKGLPYAIRKDVELARWWISQAKPLVAPATATEHPSTRTAGVAAE